MPPPQNNILPYAPAPKRWHPRQIKRSTWIKTTLLTLLCFFTYATLHGPTTAQIRLDTGDLRYCWWGIPITHRPMSEPNRSKLLTLASRSPSIPAKWVTCVEFPLRGSNSPDIMCRRFYISVATWSGEDPNIARWAMQDVADYIQHAKWGLPKSVHLLSGFVVDGHTEKVIPDWRDDAEIQLYCADHGYTP